MLERQVFKNGVVAYVSSVLWRTGAVHAFSTRIGGVSEGPFSSLNLGNPGGCAEQDDSCRIAENYRRFLEGLDLEGRAIGRVRQVHGVEVVDFSGGVREGAIREGDALVASTTDYVLSVRVADCVPVLLASEDGRHVGAVHAGWRGIVGGVVEAGVRSLRLKSGDQAIVAAIGPCIGVGAFEVGGEVIEQFRGIFGEAAPIRTGSGGKGHVDLREAVRMQLVEAGLGVEMVETSDRCTSRDAEEFFSHRRERGVTGRMAAVICARG